MDIAEGPLRRRIDANGVVVAGMGILRVERSLALLLLRLIQHYRKLLCSSRGNS